MSEHIERRRFDLESQAADRYPRIPFEVRPGTRSLEVSLRYDRACGVIDLGCEGPGGWRGWSGGARAGFVIGEDDATPGYYPGVLEPGTWWVVLGLHAVGEHGVDVEVRISLPATSGVEHGPRPLGEPAEGVAPDGLKGDDSEHLGGKPGRGSSRTLPAPAGLRWYAGDFHAHTLHSDGAESVLQLAARAARNGLDFLAVTEHNTTSHHRHLPGAGAEHGITLIPGQEITTHRGHANAFGDIGFVDFRRPAQAWLDDVLDRGGLFSVNHPIADDCAWLQPLDRVPHAVELWHSTWYADLRHTSVLAWYAAWGKEVPLVGGSDFHSVRGGLGPGAPTTWVAATDASPQAILDGLRAGRTAITGTLTQGQDTRVPDLLTAPILLRVDDELVAVDADGLMLVDASGRRRPVRGRCARFRGDLSDGPYQLVHADRQIVALCR